MQDGRTNERYVVLGVYDTIGLISGKSLLSGQAWGVAQPQWRCIIRGSM